MSNFLNPQTRNSPNSPSPAASPSPMKVYGLLNKHSPHIGYFHYSPTQTRSLNLYFYENVTPMDEVERRRRIKLHPYTGNFHFAPGKYSDLHGLEKYRKSRWKRGNPIPEDEENENDSSAVPEDGKDVFNNFLKKMKNQQGASRTPPTPTAQALPIVTPPRQLSNSELKSSTDDSSLHLHKSLQRTKSDAAIFLAPI